MNLVKHLDGQIQILVNENEKLRAALGLLISEICDLEGREGLTDTDWAEQVIALAQCQRATITNEQLAPKVVGAPKAEVTEILLGEFSLARPDDVPFLEFQAPLIAGRIVDHLCSKYGWSKSSGT